MYDVSAGEWVAHQARSLGTCFVDQSRPVAASALGHGCLTSESACSADAETISRLYDIDASRRQQRFREVVLRPRVAGLEASWVGLRALPPGRFKALQVRVGY